MLAWTSSFAARKVGLHHLTIFRLHLAEEHMSIPGPDCGFATHRELAQASPSRQSAEVCHQFNDTDKIRHRGRRIWLLGGTQHAFDSKCGLAEVGPPARSTHFNLDRKIRLDHLISAVQRRGARAMQQDNSRAFIDQWMLGEAQENFKMMSSEVGFELI